MENEYKELLKQYPFLRRIIDTVEVTSQIDKREWDNIFEEDLTKCKDILDILKKYDLIK
jgi:uncharacterized protein YutE (UPF0331/DUF86 family)